MKIPLGRNDPKPAIIKIYLVIENPAPEKSVLRCILTLFD